MIRPRELPPSHRDNDAPELVQPARRPVTTDRAVMIRDWCGECGERLAGYLCDAKTPRGACDMPMCAECRKRGATPTRDLCFAHRPQETTAR